MAMRVATNMGISLYPWVKNDKSSFKKYLGLLGDEHERKLHHVVDHVVREVLEE